MLVQPGEHVDVVTWYGAWYDHDGKPHPDASGLEDSFEELLDGDPARPVANEPIGRDAWLDAVRTMLQECDAERELAAAREATRPLSLWRRILRWFG
jgi:hypothetical protein